jgi:hypothetical protein
MKHPVYLLMLFNSITQRNVLYNRCLNFWEDCGKLAGQQCKYTCEVILLDWKLKNLKYTHCKLIISSSVNSSAEMFADKRRSDRRAMSDEL